VKKNKRKNYGRKIHFIKKIGFSESGHWNATPAPNPNFFT
jgi:hypothetical protein